MRVKQFRYTADNLGYLVHGLKSGCVVDGGDPDTIIAYAKSQNIRILYAVHTHAHPDHTMGTRELVRATGAELIDQARILRQESILLDQEPLRIIPTPGHTHDSVCFYTGQALITGDTLFNGTVGNCFSGDLQAFYRSIKKLMAYPPVTLIYAGHDYVRESLAYARTLEPDNTDLDAFLKTSYDPDHVRSTLAQELLINPFLRFNAPGIIAYLKKRGSPVATEYERWTSLMQ